MYTCIRMYLLISSSEHKQEFYLGDLPSRHYACKQDDETQTNVQVIVGGINVQYAQYGSKSIFAKADITDNAQCKVDEPKQDHETSCHRWCSQRDQYKKEPH